MEFYVVALIFIVCMIALALLIYYCQEKRDPKYGINENQRAITSIALSVGAPEILFEDEKKSSKKQKSIRLHKNAMLFLDELSDSDSEKIYYPPKSAAYAVARRMSMASTPPKRVSITPNQALEAIEYFHNRRKSFGTLPQPNSNFQDDKKQNAKRTPNLNLMQTKLSEENDSRSSISSASEENACQKLSKENVDKFCCDKNEDLERSRDVSQNFSSKKTVQAEDLLEKAKFRKKLSEDLTPTKIIITKQTSV